MSGSIDKKAVWTAEKTVALPRPNLHAHKPNPVSQGFVAPTVGWGLSFSGGALAAAIARTATTREDVPLELLQCLTDDAFSRLGLLVADGTQFSLSPLFDFLNDIERTHFAGQVGSGIAHIFMESLGYNWRANASCLTKKRMPHGDFLYSNGSVSQHGVVLTEAHGSFSSRATSIEIRKECEKKYLRQVKPWVGEDSTYGRVIHGYSVAFGCRPGTQDALISLSETKVKNPRRKTDAVPVPAERGPLAPTSMALATYRSNFLLMGALPVVEWIDWLRGSGELPLERDGVEFLILEYAGERFLASILPHLPPAPLGWWFEDVHDAPTLWRHRSRVELGRGNPSSGWFVMQQAAGERFLGELSALISGGPDGQPEYLGLPAANPVGFGFKGDSIPREETASPYEYAMFSDGLALLGRPKLNSVVGSFFWSPKGA